MESCIDCLYWLPEAPENAYKHDLNTETKTPILCSNYLAMKIWYTCIHKPWPYTIHIQRHFKHIWHNQSNYKAIHPYSLTLCSTKISCLSNNIDVLQLFSYKGTQLCRIQVFKSSPTYFPSKTHSFKAALYTRLHYQLIFNTSIQNRNCYSLSKGHNSVGFENYSQLLLTSLSFLPIAL